MAMHGTQDSNRILFDGVSSGHPTSFGQVTDSDHHAREGEYTRITRGMAKSKSKKLSQLEDVTFEGDDSLDIETKTALQGAGLMLRSRDIIL